MTTKRIANDPGQPCHMAEADYFNKLIIDLKMQILGAPFEPVSMERLEEGTKHVLALDECRRESRLW